jgi:hypothetical protein
MDAHVNTVTISLDEYNRLVKLDADLQNFREKLQQGKKYSTRCDLFGGIGKENFYTDAEIVDQLNNRLLTVQTERDALEAKITQIKEICLIGNLENFVKVS